MKSFEPALQRRLAIATENPRVSARKDEVWTAERCFIRELMNDDESPELSIAAARVPPYVTTVLHALTGVTERYVIQEGRGVVEVDGERRPVRAGDVVTIPAGMPQRVSCTSPEDLVFLCVCTPRFRPEVYRDLER